MFNVAKMLVLIGVMSLVDGCKTNEPSAIYNPSAVYLSPPEGFYANLVDEGTLKRTGRMWVPAGVTIFTEL